MQTKATKARKFSLDDLQVQSFVTTLDPDQQAAVKGGTHTLPNSSDPTTIPVRICASYIWTTSTGTYC